MEFHVGSQPSFGYSIALFLHESLIGWAAPAPNPQFQSRNPISLPKLNVALDQKVQPFFPTHPSEVAENWPPLPGPLLLRRRGRSFIQGTVGINRGAPEFRG